MDLFQCVNCQNLFCRNGEPKVGIDGDTFTTISKSSKPLLCLKCYSILQNFSNSRNNFLRQTKNRSLIKSIINAAEVRGRKSNKIYSKSTTPALMRLGESILPTTIENATENPTLAELENSDLTNHGIQRVYEEKFPMIKIVQLKSNSDWILTNDTVKSCTFCHRNFLTEIRKNRHVETGHQDPVYSFECKLCKAKFHQKWFYKQHVKIKHAGMEILFSCAVCVESFHNQSELNEHKFSVHRQTTHPFKCNYCDVAFQTKYEMSLLRDHLIDFHQDTTEAKAAIHTRNHLTNRQKSSDERRFVCDVNSCTKIFTVKADKFAHILFEHHSQKCCLVCPEEFLSSEDLLQHSQICPFTKCSNCGKILKSMLALVSHWDTLHNPSVDFPFSCELCGNRFHFYDHLLSHYNWHSIVARPRQYSCNKCGKSFAMKHFLKQHLELAHLDVKGLAQMCKKCNVTLTQKERYHLTPHKCSEKLYKCEECGLVFRSSKGLCTHKKRHQKLENGSVPHVTFRRNHCKYSRYISVKPHAEEKKFMCDICSQVYKRPDHCIRHLFAVHNIRLPQYMYYAKECKFCGKICTDNYKLKRHETTHKVSSDGTRRRDKSLNIWKCGICQEECKGMMGVRAHLINCHENTKQAEIAQSNIRLQSELDENKNEKGANNVENICSICDNYFFTIEEKEMHEDTVHEVKSRCKSCGQEFENKTDLRKHEGMHENFPCSLCTSFLRTSASFRQHLQEEHTQAPFLCEFCEEPFSTTKLLNRHAGKHHDVDTPRRNRKTKSVSQVLKSRGTKEHLNVQQFFLEKQQKYKCPRCNTLFKEEQHLRIHLKQSRCELSAKKCDSNFKVKLAKGEITSLMTGGRRTSNRVRKVTQKLADDEI